MRNVLLLFALSAMVSAQSQPPPSTPPKVSQAKQQKAESKNAKTETDQAHPKPSFVPSDENVTHEQSGNPSKNESSGDGVVKIVSDILVALATIAIAYLAYRQWRTMKGHEKALHTM